MRNNFALFFGTAWLFACGYHVACQGDLTANDGGCDCPFVGSKAPWDHIGGSAPQFEEGPPGR